MAAHAWERDGRPDDEAPAQQVRRHLDNINVALVVVDDPGHCPHDRRAAAAALRRALPAVVDGLDHLPLTDRLAALRACHAAHRRLLAS